MARTVSLKFTLEEADRFLKGLQGMGKAGEDMAARLDRAAKRAEASGPGFKKLGGAVDGLNSSFQSMASRLPVVGGLLQGLGPAGTAAAAALGAVTLGAGYALNKALEAAAAFDALGESAKQVGVGVVALQELRFAAGQTGVGIEQLDKALATMLRNQGNAINGSAELAKKFSDIGISATELRALSPQAIFLQMADGLNGLQTQAEKVAILDAIFGKGGSRLIELFDQGSAGVAKMTDELRRMGGVIDGPTVKAAGDLNDKIDALNQAIDANLNVTFIKSADVILAWKNIVLGAAQAARSLSEAFTPTEDLSDTFELEKRLKNYQFQLERFKSQTGQGGFDPFGLRADGIAEIQAKIAATEQKILELKKQGGELDKAALGVLDEKAAKLEAEIAKAAERNALGLFEQKQLEAFQKARDDAGKKSEAAAKKAQEEAIKLRKEEADWLFRITGLIENDVKEWEKKNALLPDYIRSLEQDYRLAGLTAEARAEELAVIEAAKLAVDGLTDADEARVRAIVKATSAQEAARKQIEEAAKFIPEAFDRAFDRVGSAITDAFARGEDGLINMRDLGRAVAADLAQSFLQLSLLNPLKNFLFGGSAATLSGVLGSSGGGGGGGALGMAANGASLGNFLSGGSLTSGVENFLFGAAPSGAADIANIGAAGFSFNGSSGLIGSGGIGSSGLSTALPYIGAGVAALGILRGIGVIGPGKSVGPNAGGQLIEQGGVFAVGPTGADNGGNVAGVVQELSQAVSVLNALAQGIGVAQLGDGLASYIDTFGAGGIRNAADLIKDAISKGVIEGLTEGEKSLLAASQDLNATAQQIITNRLLPGQLASQRLQLENPQQFALDAAKAERDAMADRLSEIENGGKALADLEFIYQRKIADIHEQFANEIAATWNAAGDSAALAAREAAAANDNFFETTIGAIERASQSAIEQIRAGSEAAIAEWQKESDAIVAGLEKTSESLQSFLNELDTGPLSALDTDQQYRIARAAFAADATPETARELLELSRQRDPGIGFARDSAQVRQRFGSVIAGAPGQIEAERARLSEAIGYERGVTANRIIEAEAIAAAARKAEQDRARTLNENQIRAIVGGLTDRGLGLGSERPDLAIASQNLLAQFQELLRTGGEFNGSIVPEGFYKLGFPALGFANGGMTPADRPFIVGERGPEIMRMRVPGYVTSNSDAFGNSAVVKRLDDVSARLDRLDAALISIATKTTDMEARQRKWDITGLLTRAAA